MPAERTVFIVGPTAVGKTDAAVFLAEKLSAEIVSCDAMQVYKEVAIATSKPPFALRQAVAHHLLDVVSVTQDFDVAAYNQLALQAIAGIRSRGKTPLVVGGSGMYMQVLLDGIFSGPAQDPQLRTALQNRADADGSDVLYEELQKIDPAAAQKIHPNDTRRIIRAIEVFSSAKKPISELQKDRQGLWRKGEVLIFALDRNRRELYERINQRVEQMLAEGLVDEVRKLREVRLSRTAGAMIGIKEIRDYLDDKCSLEEAKALMQMNTRRLAKRQMTWFRKDKRLQWIEVGAQKSSAMVAEEIFSCLKG